MARRFVGVTLVGVVTAEDEEEVTYVLDRRKKTLYIICIHRYIS